MTAVRLRTFSRGDLVFDVRDTGPRDGEVVILLHGFPQTSAAWDAVAPPLAGAGYRVLAPDQRGYSPGARPLGRSAYRMRELVADVLALAAAADAERFHVAGHDWGAAVAWAMAVTQAPRLRTVTALSVPHPAAFRRAAFTSRQGLRSWYMLFFQLPRVPEAFVSAGGWSRFRDGLVRTGLPARYADEYVAVLRQPGALTAAINWYRGVNPVSDARAASVEVPALLMWGTRDQFLDRAGVDATARYVDAPYRLEVLEGMSHWLPEQAPDRVVAALLPHLAQRGR